MPRFATFSTIRRLAGLALPVLGLLACDSPTDVPQQPPARQPVAYVEIIAPVGELTVGQTVVLGTKLLSAEGVAVSRPVSWVSSDTAVGTVSAAGLLTARAEGVVEVTATSEGVDASVSMSIRAPAEVVTIELDGPGSALTIGQTFAVAARVRDQDGVLLYRPITWSSSNTAVAIVSDAGLVTALAPGHAVITAAVEGRQATVAITVRPTALATATALEPARVLAGSPAFELTIRGTGFEPGATVRWADQTRPARVISPTEIRIDIAAADVQHVGGAEVRVLNPGQTHSASLFFIVEREPSTHTWDLEGLAAGGGLPVAIGSYFQGSDIRSMVDQRVTGAVLRIHEPGYGPSQWQLTVRIVSTYRVSGDVVKDEDVVFFGTIEYSMFEGYMLLRSNLFNELVLRTVPAADGGLTVWQTLHHSGDAKYEQVWSYRKR